MTVMTQVAVLFMLILAGVYTRKRSIVSAEMTNEMVNFVMHVTLPAFIISSMDYDFSKEILFESANFLLISIAIYSCVIAISFVLVRLFKTPISKKGIYQHALSFSNVAFMGYPVVSVVYGSKGVFYAVIFNLPFNILIWTYGVYLLSRNRHHQVSISTFERMKKIFNPGTVSLIIGFTFFLTNFSLPYAIKETLSLIGSTTTPLSMMIVGFLLSEIQFGELINSGKDYLVIAFRLIIIPAAVYLVLLKIGFEGYTLGIPVLITAMPIAAILPVFASLYGEDSRLASKLVFISTLGSVGTVPLFMILLNS